jgi:hypothetical protein
VERSFDLLRRFFDASGDNWTSFANPEFDAGQFVVLESCLSWKLKNVAIGSQHEGARFVEGLDGLSQTAKPDRFVLVWSVAVAVSIPCFPERTVEFPEKVDELANPEGTSEVKSVDLEGEKERVLHCSPFAREAPLEQLSPTKHCLFLSNTG